MWGLWLGAPCSTQGGEVLEGGSLYWLSLCPSENWRQPTVQFPFLFLSVSLPTFLQHGMPHEFSGRWKSQPFRRARSSPPAEAHIKLLLPRAASLFRSHFALDCLEQEGFLLSQGLQPILPEESAFVGSIYHGTRAPGLGLPVQKPLGCRFRRTNAPEQEGTLVELLWWR